MIKIKRVKYADKYLEADYGTIIIKTPLAEITIMVGSGGNSDAYRLDSVEVHREPQAVVNESYSRDEFRTVTVITHKDYKPPA